MAAYGAVASLVQLLDPDYFPAGLHSSEIQSLYEKALSLQSSLETILPARKKTDGTEPDHDNLDNRIRKLIYTAQDEIEDFIFTQLSLPDKQDHEQTATSLQDPLQKIEAAIDPLVEEAKKMAESDAKKKKDSGAADNSKNNPEPAAKERIAITDIDPVGQEEDLKTIKARVGNPSSDLQVVAITGLPGIGKTTLARYLYYKEPDMEKDFPIRAWVTVSQDYQLGEVFSKILSTMVTSGHKPGDQSRDEGKANDGKNLKDRVYQALYGEKYLVVVDDIWDTDAWDRIRIAFPERNNGSRIVLTTRSKDVAEYAKFSEANPIHTMEPLNDDHSWTLLSRIAFKDQPILSDPLMGIALKITKNCGGLPLSLTVIGGLLSQAKREDLEYWKGVEEDTYAAAKKGKEAYLDLLELSYNHLPHTLKGCFLYMGAFPEDSDIPASKLVNLWVAEGFLQRPPPALKIEERVAKKNLELLIDRNLLHVRKVTSNKLTKSCGMHDSLRDVAMVNCRNERFFHSRRKYNQILEPDTNTQRRISVHRNILMCLAEVRDSVKKIESARTLIYAGSHHHHPLPFCLTFNLLRVLDAYTVYFLEFPAVIPTLIHLRYLSFTYNGKLPATLSNLQKLQILIARRHPKIIFLGASFLPDGIWNMPQLRHLLLTETDLPMISSAHKSSTSTTPLFENLQFLSNVSAVTCTEEVIKSMPNLKKLAMWTDKPGPVGLFLNHLQQLESFKFTVLNPNPKSQVEFQPKIYFPDTLVKLKLSGCSLPWEHMDVIGRLPALQVLKLREVAFKGDNWSPKATMFRKLKFLMLEYLDLKEWEADHNSYPELKTLILRHCYELLGVPENFGYIANLELIEMVDCSPYAVGSAEEIRDNLKVYGAEKRLKVRIYSSWE